MHGCSSLHLLHLVYFYFLTSLNAQDISNTYAKLLPCIMNNILMQNNTHVIKYPKDAEKHYKELLKATERFRGFHSHIWAGYGGPWIENYFIATFQNKDLSFFGGLIPLFIQWVDVHVHDGIAKIPNVPDNINKGELVEALTKILRPDVLYVAVSQDDEGLLEIQLKFPNILVFSAGGYGHIPIPLIKGELEAIPFPKDDNYLYDFSFFGQETTHPSRIHIIHEIKQAVEALKMTPEIRHKFGHGGEWKDIVATTKYNIAPRGYGRSSFRVAEIIHIGRTFLYAYNDIPWIPYLGSPYDYYSIGYVSKVGNLSATIHEMAITDISEYNQKLKNVKNAREHYSYVGIIKQLEKFFKDPLGPNGGDLRCTPVPDTVTRRKIRL